MADPLCYMKELALKEVNPQLFTIATLTGHAARTYGDNYTVIKKLKFNIKLFFCLKAVMDNGPAKKNQIAQKLQNLGEDIGDPFEISTVRQEVCFRFIFCLSNKIFFLNRIMILLMIKVK